MIEEKREIMMVEEEEDDWDPDFSKESISSPKKIKYTSKFIP